MEINSARIKQGGEKQNWADANEYRMREAAVAYAYLKERIDSFIISREKLNAAGMDTSGIDAMIQKAREFLYIFERMKENGFYGNLKLGDLLNSADFRTIAPNGRDEIRLLAEQARLAKVDEKSAEKRLKDEEKVSNQILKNEWKTINERAKLQERDASFRKSQREKEEKEYNKIWQRGLNEREKAFASKSKSENFASGMYNKLKEAYDIMVKLDSVGFNTSGIDKWLRKAIEVRDTLNQIYLNNGRHPVTGQTSKEYLSSVDSAGVMSNLRTLTSMYEIVGREMEKIESKAALLREALNTATDPTVVQLLQNALRGLENQMELMTRRGVSDVVEQMRTNASAISAPMKTADEALKAHVTNIAEAQRIRKREQREEEKATKSRFNAVNALDNKLSRLEARKVVDFAGMDTSKLDAAIAKIRAVRNELEHFARTGHSDSGFGVNSIMRSMGLDVANREAALAIRALNGEKQQAAAATAQMTSEEQKLAQAISHSSGEMKNQSQILSDLKMMAMQYLSVWGAQSFMNSIIETGGLLEQQRLSIGAILQNAGQATELFGQIKQLALKSPFGVVELDKMSKQLTAYGFEYNELYDWTKRLADISAATGTSVDRLALALGHVRAEGALSGYTLRQFAMGNVPLLRMLAENLNISTKQVREKVRKKDVSYEDVMKVLQQLTDKGGMFYEAQETMSQALNAKYKNLRDAFDIMYNEIAESSVGEKLKDIAGVLTTGAKHWKELADVIKWTGGAFLIAKASMVLFNQALGTGTAATLKSAAADKQKEVNMLRLARQYRELTLFEKGLLATHAQWYATSSKLTIAQLTELLNQKKLGKEELYRAVALRKINKELAEMAILEMKAGTAAERRAKQQLLTGLREVTVLSRMRIGWQLVGNAIRTAGAALWGFTKIALPMAALSGLVELFARTSQMREQAKEASADLTQKATSDMKVLDETFKELQSNDYFKSSEKNGKYINGRRVVEMGIKFNEETLRKEDLANEIDNLKKKLQDLSPMYEGDLIDIDKMDNQVEQFKLIVKKLESLRHANDVTEAMSNAVTDANVDVAGKNWFTRLFGDTYTTDAKDYENKLSDIAKEVNGINEETINKIDEELGGQINKLQKKYSLDSKNSALAKVFEDWSKRGFIPSNIKGKNTTVEFYFNRIARGGMRSLHDQFAQLEADTQEMAQKMSSIVVNQFKNDPDGAIYAITSYMKKLMSIAGITDPRVMEEATRLMLEEMRKYLPKNMQQKVVDEMQRRILMEQFSNLIGSSITESTTPEEAEKAFQKYADMTIKWGEQMGYDLKKIGMDNAEAYRDGLRAKLNAVLPKTDWQKRASQVFVQNVAIKSNFDKNLDEFAQAVQKDLKDKQDYLTRNKAHLKMTLNIDTDILMNVDKLRALMDKLALEGQKKAAQGDWKGAQALYSKIDDELKPYYNALLAIEEDKTWLKKEGYPEKDPTKGGKGSQEDKNAKAVRERVRIIKEAADAFQYWREKVGDKGAWSHVLDEFGDVLEKIGITADNVQDLRGNLSKVKNSAAFKAIKDNKVKLEVEKEIAKEESQLNRKDFEKTAEEFASKIQIELDSLTRAWEIFNDVREKTGDVDLAINLSGVNYAGGKKRNLADALKERIQKDFDSAGGSIVFDMSLSDKQIDEEIKKTVPAANEKQIKGLVEEYKKWRDLQRDVLKNDISTFSQLLSSAQDYETQIRKIESNLSTQLESIDNMQRPAGMDEKEWENIKQRARELANVKAATDKLKASPQYINLMNNALVMTSSEIKAAADEVEKNLNNQLKNGALSAKDYASEMEKVHKIVRDSKLNSFFGKNSEWGAFAKGGVNGAVDWLDKAINARITELGSDYTVDANGKYNGSDKQLLNLLGKREKWENAQLALSGVALAGEIATGALKGMSDAAKSLSEMFDALGNEGLSEKWSDIADAIDGVSSVLAPANNVLQNAMSGNISGVVSSAISAPVQMVAGPITAFSKLHDKHNQRLIKKLDDEIKALEANTEVIKALRERTLGYDTGDMRRNLAQMYAQYNKSIGVEGSLTVGGQKYDYSFVEKYNKKYGKAGEAMAEYYAQNGNGNGYSQEYTNLINERQKYIDKYNREMKNKKKSTESLEEWKKKIRELDEQIMFFTQDLAKELWSIDIKGWASQIGDALWTAFENGEDAVKAFGDTASDIVAAVAKKMLVLGVMEPMMAELQNKLFGTWDENESIYKKGAIEYKKDSNGNYQIDMEGSEEKVLKVLGEYFGSGGVLENGADAAEQFYNWVKQITGIDFGDKSSSSSSKVIQGGFTENETGLLLSYVNAIRADVSVNRETLYDIRENYLNDMKSQMTNSALSLSNIESYTNQILNILNGNTEGLYQKINRLDTDLHGLRIGAWKMPMA